MARKHEAHSAKTAGPRRMKHPSPAPKSAGAPGLADDRCDCCGSAERALRLLGNGQNVCGFCHRLVAGDFAMRRQLGKARALGLRVIDKLTLDDVQALLDRHAAVRAHLIEVWRDLTGGRDPVAGSGIDPDEFNAFVARLVTGDSDEDAAAFGEGHGRSAGEVIEQRRRALEEARAAIWDKAVANSDVTEERFREEHRMEEFGPHVRSDSLYPAVARLLAARFGDRLPPEVRAEWTGA